MDCPWCRSPTNVVDSRQRRNGSFTHRRRECVKCGKRFSTKEIIKGMELDIGNVINHIVLWLKNKIIETNKKGFVVGVSGGIDSAVVSTLCAKTGYPVMCLNMPIGQTYSKDLSIEHIQWLKSKYSNVSSNLINLTDTFEIFKKSLPEEASKEIALVNTRSRLRMMALYAFSGSLDYIVAGTGNKIEDYGIGFFTKYGDGGVDISPIGDLKKTEVYTVARHLEILSSIQETAPNDGLWEDGRTDEDQIGAPYNYLEWAMDICDEWGIETWKDYIDFKENSVYLSENKKKILYIYLCRHEANRHKMEMPPVCLINK